ncbi:MAG: signal peptide peptidase SppA [Candidatus Poribacteria bacterium]|nr:signal peptide peptidase SppA [Candidatus Poribacteria bacterium]
MTRGWIGLWAVALAALFIVGCSGGVEEYQGGATTNSKFVEIRLGGNDGTEIPFLFSLSTNNKLLRTIQHLEHLRSDSTVVGVLLNLNGASLSRAESQEIAAELKRLRDAGQKVVAYADTLSNSQYALAAQADRVVISPLGSVDLIGISSEVMFYKDLFDKVGVQAEMLRAGAYKSAVEPFTRTELSDEAREMVNRLLDDQYDQMVTQIAAGRRVEPDAVKRLIDGGPYTATEALAAGLADDVKYADELDDYLDTFSKIDVTLVKSHSFDDDEEPISDLGLLLRLWLEATQHRSATVSDRDKIALVRVEGMIVPGRRSSPFQSGEYAVSGPIVAALNKAADEPTVKAIVVRIDSPGGSALASDLIWRAMKRAGAKKPVIVSMGSVAASGGYYVAVGGNHILADEGTITGSIGVFGGKFNLSGLYDLVGVHTEAVRRGQNAGLYSDDRGFTDTERERLQAQIDEIYRVFVQKSADGRKRSFEEIDAVAQGQVWTGREALSRGLVDEIGGLKRAFDVAKVHAGYSTRTKLELWELPENDSLFDSFFGAGMSRLSALPLPTDQARQLRQLIDFFEQLRAERAFAMMPFLLRFN